MFGHLFRVAQSIIRERKKAKTRSPHWGKLRDSFIKTHPTCAACGQKKLLQLHHIVPFHFDPKLELEPTNLIVLCMGKLECHLVIGHGGDYKDYNPMVVKHAELCVLKPLERKVIESMAKSGKIEANPAA
jgi:hypothetical protein